MKRIKGIISILLVLSISILSYSLYYNSLGDKKDQLLESNNEKSLCNLAIMLQNEDGEYEEKDMSTWPTDGYIFNDVLSSCENGGKLSWNDGKITLKTSGSDKCYVYFDIAKPKSLKDFIVTQVGKVENGELIKHDKEGIKEPNGAQDDGYRYSGNNPNNFICFGKGSETYNSGSGTCPLTNQYRIIGLVPVTKEDGSQEQLVKVIKSEYINETELGLAASDTSLSVNTSYAKSPRIKTTSRIHGFYWSGSIDNYSNQWSSSTLKSTLNGTYLNTTLGSTWSEKIETVQWNVGGVDDNEIIPKAMKEAEESSESEVTAQIGLMYIYDYGFASAEENWNTPLYNYNTTGNKNGNWLFNGVNEWTISYNSSLIYVAFYVLDDGGVVDDFVNNYSCGVRPVFYLKSNVEIKSDGADGSSEHPFRVQ